MIAPSAFPAIPAPLSGKGPVSQELKTLDVSEAAAHRGPVAAFYAEGAGFVLIDEAEVLTLKQFISPSATSPE
jgi:hypothetical protein